MIVSLIKACFRSPALSSPLWGPMWRQLPRAPDVVLSFLRTVPHDHTSGWAPGANKSPSGSPPRLYISKNTRVRFPQQDWSVSPIKMNTHTAHLVAAADLQLRCVWYLQDNIWKVSCFAINLVCKSYFWIAANEENYFWSR